MMKIALLVVLLGCVASGFEQEDVDWTVGRVHEPSLLRPREWGTEYPSCNGQQQSPIVIDSTETEYDENLGVIRISQDRPADTQETWLFNVNRYTLNFFPTDGHTLQFVETTYNLTKFNFVWRRSEHKIDDRRGDGAWRSYWVNQNDDQDQLVLSIFLNAIDDHDEEREYDPVIGLLDAALHKLEHTERDQSTVQNSFGRLFPSRLGNYYKYMGSLATPPCTEGITRIVTSDYSVDIPAYLLHELSELRDQNGNEITSNTRPSQPTNGRKVKRSFN